MTDRAKSELTLELDRERFQHLPGFSRALQPPRPALHQLSHRAGLAGRFRPRRSRSASTSKPTPRKRLVSLYMHLPFCESLCLFCACNVVITKDHSAAPPYLATLKREIEHVSGFVSAPAPSCSFTGAAARQPI